ncbi:MAG: chemotaxis protein CheW [Candidatus Hydrogenedentes bacterium]|nr:chemotaxis protein CheW [Candidatus Hydrogenedentota bacterium]
MAPHESSDWGGGYLVCRVCEHLWAIPIEHVQETLRPLAVEPLASMPPFVRGISVIRGSPVPVVEAATLLASENGEPSTRLVVLKTGARRVALAVQSVLGVRTLAPSSLQELPALLQKANAAAVAAIGTLDEQLLLVLRAARFIPDDVWESCSAMDAAP